MQLEERAEVLQLAAEAHAKVEKALIKNGAKKGDAEWLDKRRLLLADLSLHMVQASVQEQMDIGMMKRYLYSILTICADFMPEAHLKETANGLLETTQPE